MERVAEKYDSKNIMICLTGGEPLLHPDFFKIASRATELGFMCGITTNATLIDKDTAEKIYESGIRAVSVSLDGIREMHDWFRCQKGAFDKTVEGMKNLVAASRGKITTQFTTVVHKKNMADLDKIFEVVLETKVDSWRMVNLDPIGRALSHNDLLLDKDDYRYIFRYIKEKRFSKDVSIDITYGCAHYLGEDLEKETRDNYFICGSGIFVGSVLCNGDIYSCLDIERRQELVQGNIENDDFVWVWENKFSEFRRDKSELCKDCRECCDREFCGGDADHTWDYDHNKPLLCIKKMISE
jgi:radical SAM protein with 4Fe4S-binding SPASM domain